MLSVERYRAEADMAKTALDTAGQSGGPQARAGGGNADDIAKCASKAHSCFVTAGNFAFLALDARRRAAADRQAAMQAGLVVRSRLRPIGAELGVTALDQPALEAEAAYLSAVAERLAEQADKWGDDGFAAAEELAKAMPPGAPPAAPGRPQRGNPSSGSPIQRPGSQAAPGGPPAAPPGHQASTTPPEGGDAVRRTPRP
jgi:hypothetical protein